jgi:MbtH protein
MDNNAQMYVVVMNMEGQYSIWPAHRAVPKGWHRHSEPRPRNMCLDYVAEQWLDMSPNPLNS